MLLVGLGNPGNDYIKTRHNAGFLALDAIAEAHGLGTFKLKKALEAEVIETNIGGNKVILAKPQTFMNLSGRSIQKLVQAYSVELADVHVLYDDVTLDVGMWNERTKVSAGGHNGIKSMYEYLGKESGAKRVRIGVGTPPEGFPQKKWVLSRFNSKELKTLKGVFSEIIEKLV